jgi:magnesium chelatase subunit D
MPTFPFTAVVGQQKLKDALLLNAINPTVGGVLVRGEKGTAKSTLARGLADLLPPISLVPGCPYRCHPDDPFSNCPHCQPLLQKGPLPRAERPMQVLTLPTNATEDRVCGTLDLEKALQMGQRHFEPGILAEVHRGILYIDEVNLLNDHIVDVLLDAAAMGVNTVEREGVRMVHPSRFVLIGTMNPEEGDLRPQLLDRFGLCVDVEAILDIDARTRVIRRRLAWERDPVAFAERCRPDQQALAREVVEAKHPLADVALSDEQMEQIATLCVRLDIRSHRADIVIARAATTFAAWEGRDEVKEDDIRRAAELALPHRTRREPFQESTIDADQIAQAMEPLSSPEDEQDPGDSGRETASSPPSSPSRPNSQTNSEKVFDVGEAPQILLPTLTTDRRRRKGDGRHARSQSANRRGRYTRAVMPDGPAQAGDVAIDATLRAAAPHQRARHPGGGMLAVEAEDVRVKVREQTVSTTVLLLVDASGSMGATERMRAAKGACLSLLQDAYVRRDRVALIAFRDQGADVLLQPTDSVELAHERLKSLPTGGQTPLGHGLTKTLELAQQMRRRDPATMVLAVLISDGKANVPYDPALESSPFEEARDIARRLVQSDVRLLVLDTEDGFLTLGLARDLAEFAQAEYVKLADLEAVTVERAIRTQL